METQSGRSLASRYESLIRMAQVIREHRDPRDLFNLLARELSQCVQFDAIVQFDEAANKVQWQVPARCGTPGPAQTPAIPREETLAWWVYEHQMPLVIPSVARESRFPRMMQQFRAYGIQSVCALPLTTVHRRLGSLVIASEHPGAYSHDEVQFLSLVAAQVALAMDDARNFHALQLAQDRLELLLDLTNRVVSNLDLRDLLQEISASIRRVMLCDGVGVALPDPDDGQLRIYALDFPGSKRILAEELRAPIEEQSALTKVFRSGEPLNLTSSDLRDDRLAVAEGIQAICHLPLAGPNRVAGVLSLGRLQEAAFSKDDLDFLSKVASQVAIAVENALAYGQIAGLKDRLAQEKLYLEDEIRSDLNFEEIIGKSDALRRVLKQVETVAPTDSTVLIYGETGTGKELIARAVHNLNARRSNAFVKLNCAAIPTGLLESELFGHEKGAFTGAIAQRIGRFELANRGTVFLDEIGEIPLELQPKLLRVLQEREFERLGSSRTLRSDARLIASTNRDLQAMVEEQKFRSDLFYRLNVFPIHVPPLRERPEDIPLLVRHFVQQFSRRTGKDIDTIPSESMNALVRYQWPGNIRELQNVIERAVIVSTGSVLNVSVSDLTSRNSLAQSSGNSPSPSQLNRVNIRSVIEEAERTQIVSALERANWVVAGPAGAAELLGMKRSTLQFRMRKLGIRVSRTGQ